MKDKDLPSICPDHPGAQIRKEWTRTQYQIPGGLPGVPLDYDYHYYCNECGRELCSPKEYERRKKEGKE